MKISRERVGIEVEKMLQGMSQYLGLVSWLTLSLGPNPRLALSLIHSLALFDAIFTPPIDALPPLPTDHMSIATDVVWHIISASETLSYSNLKRLADDKSEQYLAWLLASVSPWKGHMFPGTDTKKRIPAAATAVREGLKLNAKICNAIVNSYRDYESIQEVVQNDSSGDKLTRGKAGMFIRRLKAEWKSQYLCALLLEVIPDWGTPNAEKVLQKYSIFLSRIFDLGLEDAYDLRPILGVRTPVCLARVFLIWSNIGRRNEDHSEPEGWTLADVCLGEVDGVATREP